jgi:hypothetical protein
MLIWNFRIKTCEKFHCNFGDIIIDFIFLKIFLINGHFRGRKVFGRALSFYFSKNFAALFTINIILFIKRKKMINLNKNKKAKLN